jgi:hypothetical protein
MGWGGTEGLSKCYIIGGVECGMKGEVGVAGLSSLVVWAGLLQRGSCDTYLLPTT